MMASTLDLDAEAVHQLAQRRTSQPLMIGFVISVAALLELMSWQEIDDAPDGTRQWRPPESFGDDACATLHAADGGFVDLRAGALRERHVSPWSLLARLSALAPLGYGAIPAPNQENRHLAARALAYSAGVFEEATVVSFRDDLEVVGPVFDQISASANRSLG